MRQMRELSLFFAIQLVIITLVGCGQLSLNKGMSKPVSATEKVLDASLNDMVWISIEKDGLVEGAYWDVVVTRKDDPELFVKLMDGIRKGIVERASAGSSSDGKPIVLGMRTSKGRYIESVYASKRLSVLDEDRAGKLISIRPTSEFNQLIEQIIERKISLSNQKEKDVGQVRNNKLVMVRTMVRNYWNSPLFNEFAGSNLSPEEYEQSLLDEAKTKGINEVKLKGALEVAKSLKGKSVEIYPVIIETGTYRNKDSFMFVFTWEYKDINLIDKDKVKKLGHIFIVGLEADSKKVFIQESCK